MPEKLYCAHCKQSLAPLRKKILNGLAVTGEKLVCPLCGGTMEQNVQQKHIDPFGETTAPEKKLTDLFGDDSETKESTDIFKDAGELKICRDCRWCIFNPFECRCTKYGKLVEPTADCPDFQNRPTKK